MPAAEREGMATAGDNGLDAEEALARIEELAGEHLREIAIDDDGKVVIDIGAGDLRPLVKTLRDDGLLSYRYLVYITAVDWEDHMQALYLFRSMKHAVQLEVRAVLDRDNPSIPSIAIFYSTACWHERETYDLMGVMFEGHPELTRILTGRKEDMFPLRKDARPKRVQRRERTTGLPPALRLPGERDWRERA